MATNEAVHNIIHLPLNAVISIGYIQIENIG